MREGLRTVFGISPGSRSDSGFVFIEVLGEILDGRLVRVADPKHEFPNVGDVYLDEEHRIPPAGTAATFRVAESKSAPDSRRAKYSVVEHGRQVPIEIVPIPVAATSPNEIRNILLKGISTPFPVSGLALVELLGGEIVGPVRCEAALDGRGLVCRNDGFFDPLGLWPSRSVFETLQFQAKGNRVFSSLLTSPEPPAFIDCSDLEHAIRSVLKLARDAGGSELGTTKKQLDTLSKVVADLSVKERLIARLVRVREAFERGDATLESLRQVADFLAVEPNVAKELENLKERVKKDEEVRAREEQSAINKKIGELRSSRKQAEDQLARLQQQISNSETELGASVSDALDKLQDKIELLRKDPSELLSEIAILRPFLRPAGDSAAVGLAAAPVFSPSLTETTTRLQERSFPRAAEVLRAKDSSQLTSHIAANLSAAGFALASSKRLARETVAAALAGQLILFSGSGATMAATAIAVALSGKNQWRYSVPVGLLLSEGVSTLFNRNDKQCDASGQLGTIVLEGCNRSALDMYGEEIVEAIAATQLSSRQGNVVVIGTVAAGPIGLSLTAQDCELGPVLDTDVLIAASSASGDFKSSEISLGDWRQWTTAASRTPELPADLSELILAAELTPGLLWSRTLARAYSSLESLPTTSGSSFDSLLFGWLLPHCHADGRDRADSMKKLLDARSPDSSDPRVAKLASKLFIMSSEARGD